MGSDWLSTRDQIERYAGIARRVSPSIWVRPYGGGIGEADDHLHIDIGYAWLEPRDSAGIAMEAVEAVKAADVKQDRTAVAQ